MASNPSTAVCSCIPTKTWRALASSHCCYKVLDGIIVEKNTRLWQPSEIPNPKAEVRSSYLIHITVLLESRLFWVRTQAQRRSAQQTDRSKGRVLGLKLQIVGDFAPEIAWWICGCTVQPIAFRPNMLWGTWNQWFIDGILCIYIYASELYIIHHYIIPYHIIYYIILYIISYVILYYIVL